MTTHMFGRLNLGLIALTLAAACATNPATGKRQVMLMSESQEIGIGQQSHPDVIKEMGEYQDAELQRYISDIGLRLAQQSERPGLPWHFTIVDQPVVNAFAVPGGFIYITRGILAYLDNEAQLAGVIGHEIGHVTARHSAQQYTRQIGGTIGLAALSIFVPAARPLGDVTSQALGVLFLKYGRGDEVQADQLGAKYAATHGWDPRQVPEFLTTLGKLSEGSEKGIPNWLSTHPEPAARVQDVQPVVQKLLSADRQFATRRDDYLKRIDGIMYGDNPAQGIVRGTTFLHPGLRLRIEFPEGWDIQNTPQQVVAKAPGADVFILMEIAGKAQGRDVREFALDSMEAAGFEEVQGERTATIDGSESFEGAYRGQMEGLGPVTARASHIVHDGQIYLVAGIVARAGFAQADGAFVRTIRSFRSLSAAEAENIHPNRIDLYTVRGGDTWQSIAQRSGGVVTANTLAIMNNSQRGDTPQPGARIKIVVGD